MQPLETQIDVEDRLGLNGHEPFAELLGNNDLELVLAHLTGTVDEVVHPHRVGRLLEFVHNIRVYPRLRDLDPGLDTVAERPTRPARGLALDIGPRGWLVSYMSNQPTKEDRRG
jgi:hypothetical protein